MVLRPMDQLEVGATCAPAWEAVARSQKQPSRAWWLIAQPDHADLAGDLAARIQWESFPALDDDVLEAIRLHDEGWKEFLLQANERESRLMTSQQRSYEEVRGLVDALQFCDLLSLYLCCGSREEVEFPQVFQGQTIRARYDGGLYRAVPSIFVNGASL